MDSKQVRAMMEAKDCSMNEVRKILEQREREAKKWEMIELVENSEHITGDLEKVLSYLIERE